MAEISSHIPFRKDKSVYYRLVLLQIQNNFGTIKIVLDGFKLFWKGPN